ncbi:MAG: hypothetical protein ACHREM_26175 [Polyangiales bacterium]
MLVVQEEVGLGLVGRGFPGGGGIVTAAALTFLSPSILTTHAAPGAREHGTDS